MPLDPIVESMLQQMAAAGGSPLEDMSPESARVMYRTMNQAFSKPKVHAVEDQLAGDVPVRIYRPGPERNLPCLVYFHGGGWVIGDIETHDAVCRGLATETRCVVIATGYRLAPEHPFPAPLEDCCNVTDWVASHATDLGIDRDRIAVGGDSAGGNLAACVCLAAKQDGGPALIHQLLIYPVTDTDLGTSSYMSNGDGYMLTKAGMAWFFKHYLGDDPGNRTNPRVAPLRASDLRDLPSATIITAEFDPLRDEGEAYGARLRAAGVDTMVQRFDGMIHGFFGMSDLLSGAREANKLACMRLSAAFSHG